MNFGIRIWVPLLLLNASYSKSQELKVQTRTPTFLNFDANANSSTMGDRLVLEIEQNTYSQREVEVYFLLKSVSFLTQSSIQEVTAQNWDLALELFAADMIIYIETKRLGRYQPNTDKISALAKIAEKKMNADPSLQYLKQALEIDRNVVDAKIAELIQIDEFKKLKGTAKAGIWQEKLQERYVVRRYQGADFYRKIAPNPRRF